MDYSKLLLILVLLNVLLRFDCEAGGRLSYNFYHQSCPQLESIVRDAVHSASFLDPTTPAAFLRLLFHDCQVQGCDASILLDSENVHSEMASLKNFGVRKRNTINLIKSALEQECPRQVSCADILVLAARDAVAVSGGPRISVPLGRRDSSAPPNLRLTDHSLPSNDIGLDATLDLFLEKGMTIEETVAILGAHTLGVTHCYSLRGRVSNHPMNAGFVNALKLRCPADEGTWTSRKEVVPNDLTPVLFDNEYFVKAMKGRGVLNVDAAMPLDSRTRPFVHKFAADQNAFFRSFSSAFLKLSSSNVLTGTQGVIRSSCNRLD